MRQKTKNCIYIILFIFVGCLNQNKDTRIEQSLSNVKANTIFSLDTIIIQPWDSVYIFKPYNKIVSDTVKYNIPQSVLKSINTTLMTDGHCVLLFFKDKQLVYYSFISRIIADFSSLEKDKYNFNQIYQMDSCRKIVVQ